MQVEGRERIRRGKSSQKKERLWGGEKLSPGEEGGAYFLGYVPNIESPLAGCGIAAKYAPVEKTTSSPRGRGNLLQEGGESLTASRYKLSHGPEKKKTSIKTEKSW